MLETCRVAGSLRAVLYTERDISDKHSEETTCSFLLSYVDWMNEYVKNHII
jgi:hypothetical protein